MATIYDMFQLDPDEAEAIGYADRLTPAQGLAADRRLFEQRAVRGIEGLGRTALGLPQSPRADRQSAAAELTALAQKVRPGTEEFYAQAIPILQKYNMPAEAAQMEQARLALETGKGEMDPLMKMKRARDLLMKAPDVSSPAGQAALAAIDRKIAEYGTKPRTEGQDHPFVKLMDSYEQALMDGNEARSETLLRMINSEIAKKEQSGEDVARLRLELAEMKYELDRKKDERKVDEAETSAVSALQGSVRTLDEEIRSGTALLNHPGLSAITGPINGYPGLDTISLKGGDAADAAGFYAPIEGQVFIRALQDLKATSKTGASGLGQLTEVEGGKIQAARAALRRQQTTPQFRQNLQHYLTTLQNARKVAEGILTKKKAEIPAAPAPFVSGPPKVDPRAITAPKAAPAAPAAPAARTFKSTPIN